MPRPRRDPSKPGVAGLTAAHLESIRAGRQSIVDVARDLGISKQVLSRALKVRGVAVPTVPVAGSSAYAPDGLSPIDFSSPEAIKGTLDGTGLSLLAIIGRDAARIAADPNGTLGPSASKAMAQALNLIRENLIASGVIPPPAEGRPIPIMSIQVMSEEAEAEVRAIAEAEIAMPIRRDTDDDETPGRESSPGLAASQSEYPDPKTLPVDQLKDSRQTAQEGHTAAPRIPADITSPADLRAWLSLYGRKSGARCLRALAESVGVQTGAGMGQRELVEQVVARIYQ